MMEEAVHRDIEYGHGPLIAAMATIAALVAFTIFVVLISVFHVIILEEIATVAFFVFVLSLLLYFYFKGAKSFTFVRAHPIITFVLFIGLAISTVSTGLTQFIYSGPYTVQHFVHLLLNEVAISQTAQLYATQGGFALFGLLFGFFWTIVLLLFLYDLISEGIKTSLGHSIFPLKVETTRGLVLVIIILIVFGIYTVAIWAATAISGQLQIDPFFGTVAFISAAYHGQVNLLSLQVLAT